MVIQMIEIHKGLNKDIFLTLVVSNTVAITLISSQYYTEQELNDFVWYFFNINFKNEICTMRYNCEMNYWVYRLEYKLNTIEDVLFNFIKYQNDIFVNDEDKEFFKNKEFISNVKKREDINVGYERPSLVIDFVTNECSRKVKIYDYQFELLNKEIYKGGNL